MSKAINLVIMKICLSALAALLPLMMANAGNLSEPGKSTLLIESGSVTINTGSGGDGYDASNEPASSLQLFARAQDDDEQHGKAKGHDKNKGKGKAKGHHEDENGDTAEGKDSNDSAAANPQPSQPPAPKSAPASGVPTAAATPAAPTKLSPAELKTQTDQHLHRISALDKNTATSSVRFSTISKETGVPVATLQAQHKAHAVGSGGLLIANEMAKATGKPAATFMTERLQGKDWNRIAAENKFDLTPVLPKLERLQQSMETATKPAKL